MAYISKGHRMMVFVNGEAIALATNHQLSITPSILEERTKDDGDAPVGEFDTYTWGITCDSIVGTNDNVSNEQSIVDLIDTMLAMEKVIIVTDAATPTTGSVPASGWAESADNKAYAASRGEAYIESISVSAPSTGSATASISFKGQGELS